MRLAVFSSANGSTFAAIAQACRQKTIPAECVLVLTNNPDTPVLQRAQDLGVESVVLSALSPNGNWDEPATQILRNKGTDFICLAGFASKIGPQLLENFPKSIVNTHPSLLPKYGGPGMYGLKVHQAVIANHETITGVSVHYVDKDYDSGQIIDQIQVPILTGDTAEILQERLKVIEKEFLVQTLSQLLHEHKG